MKDNFGCGKSRRHEQQACAPVNVQGLRFGVYGLRFRVGALGFRVRVYSLRLSSFRVKEIINGVRRGSTLRRP